MKTFKTKLPFAFLLAASLTPFAKGATIQWGGVISSTVLLSDGTVVNDTNTPDLDLTFELGAFDAGFVPSDSNMEDWSDNWKSIDQTSFALDSQYFTQETKIVDGDVGIAGIQFNGNTFTPGEAVYVWGYNQQAVNESTEWVLMLGISGTDTDDLVVDPTNTNWEVPDLADANQGTFPLNWRSSTATHSLFGTTGSETGGGLISVPGDGVDIQFATVPEPSAWLLGYLAFLGWLGLSRHRS
jgi:hypothetical protein